MRVIYVRLAHIVKLKSVLHAHIAGRMIDETANLLGAVALAVSDRIHETAREIVSHSGETPAASIIVGAISKTVAKARVWPPLSTRPGHDTIKGA